MGITGPVISEAHYCDSMGRVGTAVHAWASNPEDWPYQPILDQGIQLEPTAAITLVPAGRNVTV
jgi:hypothetical protein